MSTFPSSLDNLPESHADGTAEVIHASTINDLASAVNAVESVTQPVVNGITADVTAANLNALTGGGQTSLHSHAGGGATVLVRTTHILSAQLLDLHNTPVELVPAPGPGNVLAAIGGFTKLTSGGTPYNWSGTPTIRYAYPPGGGRDPGVLDGPAPTAVFAEPAVKITNTTLDGYLDSSLRAPYEDQPLVLFNLADALIDGNGTLDVTVMYLIV